MISSLLAIVLVVTVFSGCSATYVQTEAETSDKKAAVSTEVLSQVMTLGYSTDDAINPYFMTTDINTELTSLMYEPLFTTDDSFCAQKALAASYTQSDNKLTVKINPACSFSDGTAVSSSDAVYSFNRAKSANTYKNELLAIASAAATDSQTVVFTLSKKISNAVDSLVFPVVKTSTADTADSIPTGTGLYKLTSTSDGKELTYNSNCTSPEPNIKTIKLVELSSSSTLIHTLELGSIDAYFDDLSTGSYSQANAASTKTNLPNLVFLGMNSASYGLSNSAVRQAIYYSLNRQSIVKNSYKNYAVESYTPFHPEWHSFVDAKYDTTSLTLDYAKAQTLMSNAGFSSINYTLIVYSGNNFKVAAAKEIAECLKNININVTVSELTWDAYNLALSGGSYDLYIGEVKLPSDMDLSAVFTKTNPIIKGMSVNDTTITAYEQYAAGNINVSKFLDSFKQNVPFAPICFRMGALVYSNKIKPAADCDYNNVFKNIYELTVSK